MLTSDEWELAARYIDDANDDGDIEDANEYYPGNYASGADDAYDVTATSDYDGDGDTESTIDVAEATSIWRSTSRWATCSTTSRIPRSTS